MQVAVYGTLKKGYHNNHVLGTSPEYIGSAQVQDYALMCMGQFPAAFRFLDRAITVEVWDIDASAIDACDQLEGVGTGWYKREEILTKWGKAFMYTRPPIHDLMTGQMWFPSGQWYGMATPKVKWLGMAAEMRLAQNARMQRSTETSQSSSIYTPPPNRTSGSREKVWDPKTMQYEYVLKAEPETLTDKVIAATKARDWIAEAKKGETIPEVKLA